MSMTEEIKTLPIAEIKLDFYNLMNKIVVTYGDNQEGTRVSKKARTDGAESYLKCHASPSQR